VTRATPLSLVSLPVGHATTLLDRLGLPGWAAATVALCLSALAAFLFRVLLVALATALAKQKSAHTVDVLIKALRGSVTLLLFLAGVEVSLQIAELPGRWGVVPPKVVSVLTIFVAAYGFGRGLLAVLREFTPLSTRLAPISGFITGVVRALVGAVAILVALESLGVSVTPVLASLGVGSVAVALALQETLGNFFAGIAVLADHPVRIGEYVKIEPDVEGRVVAIGWRTTSLLDLHGNLAILPNSTVARSVVRNFDRPGPGETVPIRVLLEHGADVSAAIAAARRALEKLDVTVLATNVLPAGLELTAVLPIPSRENRDGARSEAIQALLAAFAEAGIGLARMPETAAPPEKA
ncbi:MAG TPA: mechanosensitive ion channel family protein, partial [Thermoanaerobaculia bacterium]|nr:mechanosensitive ion channel family protein [Thermoanaerobaculia bacterium]